MGFGIFGDAVNWVENTASDAYNGAKDLVNGAADGAKDLGNAAVQGVEDLGKGIVNGAETVAKPVIHLGSDAIDAISHPTATARAVLGDISHGAKAFGQFVGDHSGAIVTGLETAGTVALYASGLGPIGGALVSAGVTATNDILHHKSAGDTVLDSAAAAGDQLLPGSGHTTEAVVKGIEHGDSAQQIVHDAGLGGLGVIAGPAVDAGAKFVDDLTHGHSPGRIVLDGLDAANEFVKSSGHAGLDTAGAGADASFSGGGLPLSVATTVVDDFAHGRSPGRVLLDGVSQYVNEASGAGTGHGNLVGEGSVIALNDVVDGKSGRDIALDIAKAYVHEAAGGDASPAAQFTDTFFNDLQQHKSPGEIAMDMVHKGEGMFHQIEPALPAVVNQVLGTSDLPGAKEGATFVNDILNGKTPGQAFEHTVGQAAGDLFNQSGLGDDFKQVVGQAGDAFDQSPAGRFFNQVVGQAGDAFDQSGLGDVLKQAGSYAHIPGDLLPGGVVGKLFGEFGQGVVSHGGPHPDWVGLNPQPLPPMPNPDGGDIFSKVISWAGLNPQPLPPGPDPQSDTHLSDPIAAVGLNPQPLPPGPDPQTDTHLSDPIAAVGLNPQPLPPGPDPQTDTHLSDPITAVGLNPQPLPPGPDPQTGIHLSDVSHILTSGPDLAAHAILAAVNPQPLPPAPEPLQDYGMVSVPAVHDYPLH